MDGVRSLSEMRAADRRTRLPPLGLTPPLPRSLDPPGAGADVHARNLKSWAPIHSAASAGHLEAALRLVVAGATWRPTRGAGAGDADAIRLLMRKGGYKVGP
jgi:hypothetical protein